MCICAGARLIHTGDTDEINSKQEKLSLFLLFCQHLLFSQTASTSPALARAQTF